MLSAAIIDLAMSSARRIIVSTYAFNFLKLNRHYLAVNERTYVDPQPFHPLSRAQQNDHPQCNHCSVLRCNTFQPVCEQSGLIRAGKQQQLLVPLFLHQLVTPKDDNKIRYRFEWLTRMNRSPELLEMDTDDKDTHKQFLLFKAIMEVLALLATVGAVQWTLSDDH